MLRPRSDKIKMILVLLTLSCLPGCRKQVEERDAQPVRVAIVEAEKPENHIRYSATVQPLAQVDLTFRIGGYVQSILYIKDASNSSRQVEAGDVIHEGQVLAEVRPTDYQAHSDSLKSQLDQAHAARLGAQAQVDEAVAAYEQAQLTFKRAQTLFSAEAMTKPEFDEARTTLDRAEARLAAAKSNLTGAQSHIEEVTAGLKEADTALSDTRIVAPFTGILVERRVERGSLAQPGTIGFVIAKIDKVKVTFGVPDVALSSFKLGQKLPLTTESVPRAVFDGRVSSISSSADVSTRTYTVELSVPNPTGLLKAGMIAAVELGDTAKEPFAPEIPLSAVVHTAAMDSYGVFVVESQDGKATARLRNVGLGRVNGKLVAIASGLKPGEHIVEDGGLQLANGEPVREIR